MDDEFDAWEIDSTRGNVRSDDDVYFALASF